MPSPFQALERKSREQGACFCMPSCGDHYFMVSLVKSEAGLGSININVSLHPKAKSPHAMYPSGPFVKECPGKCTMTPTTRPA